MRDLCTKYGAVLILDEVMTGFRVGLTGAQGRYGIQPDLTTLGKVIGGGMPVGAFGGRREIMQKIAPRGPVYQAGTLSGNPLAMVAGIATLEELTQVGVYEKLERRAAALSAEWKKIVKGHQARIGSLFCTFFTDREVVDYATAKTSDTKRYAAFFHAMLNRGVYLAPSQFEVGFLSLAHTEQDAEQTLAAAAEAVKTL